MYEIRARNFNPAVVHPDFLRLSKLAFWRKNVSRWFFAVIIMQHDNYDNKRVKRQKRWSQAIYKKCDLFPNWLIIHRHQKFPVSAAFWIKKSLIFHFPSKSGSSIILYMMKLNMASIELNYSEKLIKNTVKKCWLRQIGSFFNDWVTNESFSVRKWNCNR